MKRRGASAATWDMRLCEESHILYPLGIATIEVLVFFPQSVGTGACPARGNPRLAAAARQCHPADCPDSWRGCARLATACGRGSAVPSGRLSGQQERRREAGHGLQPRLGGAIRQTVRTVGGAARSWPWLAAPAQRCHPAYCPDSRRGGSAVPSGGQSGRQEGGQSGIFKLKI